MCRIGTIWPIAATFLGSLVFAIAGIWHSVLLTPAAAASPDVEQFYALPPGAIGRLGSLDLRSGGDPAVAFSSDGKTFFTSARINEIRAWDLKTHRLLRRFELQPIRAAISQLHCLPNGSLSVLALDGFVLLVDAERGTIIHELRDGEKGFLCIDITSDGKILAVGDRKGQIRLFETSSGQEMPFGARHPRKADNVTSGWVHHVNFSRDGKRLVSDGAWDRRRVWEVPTGKELTSFDPDLFSWGAMAFSPDDRGAAIPVYVSPPDIPSRRRSATALWHLDPLKPAVQLEEPTWGSAIHFRSDGKLLILGSHWIGAWATQTGKRRFSQRLPGHSSRLALSPDEKYVVYQGRWWELETGKELHVESGHVGSVRALALSADGRVAASFASDGTVRVWEVPTQRQRWYRVLTNDVPTAVSLAFSPAGDKLAVLAQDQRVYVLDAGTGQELFHSSQITGQPTEVHWSPNGKWIAAGGGSYTIFLFDATTGELWKRLVGYDGSMNCDWRFAFSPDSKSLAAPAQYNGTDRINRFGKPPTRKKPGPNDYDSDLGPPNELDGKTHVVLWDIASGKRTRILGPGDDGTPHGMAFSADGTTLAQQRKLMVYVHETQTGKVVGQFPVNHWPVVGYSRGRVVIGRTAYNPATGAKEFELPVTTGTCAISSDGTRLILAEYDGCTPLIWSLENNRP